MTFCLQEKRKSDVSSFPAAWPQPDRPSQGAWGQAGVPGDRQGRGPPWPCAVPVTERGCSRALLTRLEVPHGVVHVKAFADARCNLHVSCQLPFQKSCSKMLFFNTPLQRVTHKSEDEGPARRAGGWFGRRAAQPRLCGAPSRFVRMPGSPGGAEGSVPTQHGRRALRGLFPGCVLQCSLPAKCLSG